MSSRKKTSSPDDPIAEALRQAGPRPPLPAFDLEALGAPALEVWQRKMAQRRARRQRTWALAATLLVICGAVLWWSLVPGEPIASVTARTGGRLEVGMSLAAGRRLETGTEPAEGLALDLASGHRLRLDVGTELRLVSAQRLDLLRGGVYVEAAPEAPLRIHAAGTFSEHLGTRYEVRVEHGRATVRVREGTVRVAFGEQSVEIAAGQLVRRDPGGDLEVEEAPVHGPSWRWILRAAPPFESDGATLESFLRWVERETGWKLEVAPQLLLDPSGEAILVRGSVAGLPLEEALRRVLEGAALEHGVEAGVLRVGPLGAGEDVSE